MITNEMIKQIALANGFKLKAQPDGIMDLNPYVYEFARALLASQMPPATLRFANQPTTTRLVSDEEKLASHAVIGSLSAIEALKKLITHYIWLESQMRELASTVGAHYSGNSDRDQAVVALVVELLSGSKSAGSDDHIITETELAEAVASYQGAYLHPIALRKLDNEYVRDANERIQRIFEKLNQQMTKR